MNSNNYKETLPTRFGFANHPTLITCSYPTRSGCKEEGVCLRLAYLGRKHGSRMHFSFDTGGH